MYVPRHFHWAYPIFTILLGFFLSEQYGKSWDMMLLVRLPLAVIAVSHGAYIWQAGVMYQGWMTSANTGTDKRQEAREQEARDRAAVLDLEPLAPMPAVNVYQQTTTMPRFDKERNFAVTLLRMHELGQADLREERWVKTKKFVRAEFVAMLDNWKKYGIIERAGDRKNAPYTVARWDAVRVIASGNPLPRSN